MGKIKFKKKQLNVEPHCLHHLPFIKQKKKVIKKILHLHKQKSEFQ